MIFNDSFTDVFDDWNILNETDYEWFDVYDHSYRLQLTKS